MLAPEACVQGGSGNHAPDWGESWSAACRFPSRLLFDSQILVSVCSMQHDLCCQSSIMGDLCHTAVSFSDTLTIITDLLYPGT